MQITITGTQDEIADLAQRLQGRQPEKTYRILKKRLGQAVSRAPRTFSELPARSPRSEHGRHESNQEEALL